MPAAATTTTEAESENSAPARGSLIPSRTVPRTSVPAPTVVPSESNVSEAGATEPPPQMMGQDIREREQALYGEIDRGRRTLGEQREFIAARNRGNPTVTHRRVVRSSAPAPTRSTFGNVRRLRVDYSGFDQRQSSRRQAINELRTRHGLDEVPSTVRDCTRIRGEPVTYKTTMTVHPRRSSQNGPAPANELNFRVGVRAKPLRVRTQYNEQTRVFEQTSKLCA